MKKKGVIFDLDGTLWDSTSQVVPEWNIVFSRNTELNTVISLEEMRSLMGKTTEEIGSILFPNIDEKRRINILNDCCNEERVYLSEHGGRLYSDMKKTISYFSEKYHLYIVSNCQDGYVQTFLQYHAMGAYFEDIEMSGRTGKKKGENIRLIVKRNQLDKGIYIGDTEGDAQAAYEAAIPFVYAEYGFGKVNNYKISISKISELPEVVKYIF